MRPRYLEVEGLQSFTELQCIDFDRLSETGLFGIFGPTGSGKSTILDAITLALYGSVQRASNRTQGIMNTRANDMKVSFVFDLQKEGTRKTYRIERVFKRKKDSDISIETKLIRLFEQQPEGDRILADKLGEVNSYIIELIGLQFDDFTRSVVLPQNKFQEFLLSPKSDKTKMLERIFYLEEYGRVLSEKLNKKLSVIRQKHAGLEGALSTLGDISLEQLISSESRAQEALKLKHQHEENFKCIETRYHELKNAWEQSIEYNELSNSLEQLLLHQDETDKKRRLYERAQKANAMTELINEHTSIQKSLEATESEIAEAKLNLVEEEKELEHALQTWQQKSEALKLQHPELIEYKTRLQGVSELVKDITAVEVRLRELREKYQRDKQEGEGLDRSIAEKRQQLEKLDKEISMCKLTIDKIRITIEHKKNVQKAMALKEAADKHQLGLEETAKKHTELKKEVQGMETERNAIAELYNTAHKVLSDNESNVIVLQAKKPITRDVLLNNEREHHALKVTLDKFGTSSQELQRRREKLEELNKRLESERENQLKAEQELDLKVIDIKQLELEDEELAKQDANQHAYALAKELSDGFSCPVCGSLEHPMPASRTDDAAENIEDRRRLIKEKLKELSIAAKKSEGCIVRADTTIRSLNMALQELEKEIEHCEKELKSLLQELPEEYKLSSLDKMKSQLENQWKRNEAALKELEDWEKQYEELIAAKQQALEELNKHKLQKSSIEVGLNINGAALAKLDGEMREAAAKVSESKSAYLSYISLQQYNDPHNELERIEKNELETERLQKLIVQLQAEESGNRSELERFVEAKAQCSVKLSDIEVEGRGLKAQREELEKRINSVLSGKELHKEMDIVEMKINSLRQEEEAAEKKLGTIKERSLITKSRLDTLQNQKNIYNDSCNKLGEKLEKELSSRGFNSKDEVVLSMLDMEHIKKLSEEVEQYQKARLDIATRMAIIDSRLKGSFVARDEWDSISTAYEEALAIKEQAITALENARSTYNYIKSNYEKWVLLDKELQQVNRRKEMLELIQKLLKGNGFIEYISEERLRYIAREASETLGVLTKCRYSLELDTENGFVIRDNSNGGVLRMVASLSGGETFLTSLSLALALSSQLQLKGQSPLEFFFLDEGFGTLDSSLLEIVIDSLERLSSSKRVIGLISHVPELKSRIARRLLVEPPDREGKGSRVYIEKA